MTQLLLLFGFCQAAVGTCGKLLLELVDSTSRINKLQFTGVERVAIIANIDLQLRSRAASCERVTTTAFNGCFLVVWVDAFFHGNSSMSKGSKLAFVQL